MPVYLGHDEFPDEVLYLSEDAVMRMFLERATRDPLHGVTAKQRIEVWSGELRKKKRRAARRSA